MQQQQRMGMQSAAGMSVPPGKPLALAFIRRSYASLWWQHFTRSRVPLHDVGPWGHANAHELGHVAGHSPPALYAYAPLLPPHLLAPYHPMGPDDYGEYVCILLIVYV